MTAEPKVHLQPAAAATMEAASWAAIPRETGGILIGWRCQLPTLEVTVCAALLIEDPVARHTTYRLDHRRAQQALHDYLDTASNPYLGYVGEWHSHPAPQPPSGQDMQSLRSFARAAGGPVALLVPALNPNDGTLTWHTVLASKRHRLRTIQTSIPTLVLEPTA